MNEEERTPEWLDVLAVMLLPWQIDELIDAIREQPAWVAVGRDPMEGFVGEAPPVEVWRLN